MPLRGFTIAEGKHAGLLIAARSTRTKYIHMVATRLQSDWTARSTEHRFPGRLDVDLEVANRSLLLHTKP